MTFSCGPKLAPLRLSGPAGPKEKSQRTAAGVQNGHCIAEPLETPANDRPSTGCRLTSTVAGSDQLSAVGG